MKLPRKYWGGIFLPSQWEIVSCYMKLSLLSACISRFAAQNWQRILLQCLDIERQGGVVGGANPFDDGNHIHAAWLQTLVVSGGALSERIKLKDRSVLPLKGETFRLT
jgi:hypothetical protein